MTKNRKKINIQLLPMQWAQDFTLGGKARIFKWSIDESCLYFIRNFKGNENQNDFIRLEDVQKIVEYVEANKEVRLANNIEKIRKGTEQEGIGKFMSETIDNKGTFIQLSSQLCALFVSAGIFESNGKKSYFLFKVKQSVDWRILLQEYYKKMTFGKINSMP